MTNEHCLPSGESTANGPEGRIVKIRELNDSLRRTLKGGRVIVTRGVMEIGEDSVTALLRQVTSFNAFDADNDPYGEHDFGSVTVEQTRFFWKIDYYDRRLEAGSPDPSNPAVTTRVLTIMLASEY